MTRRSPQSPSAMGVINQLKKSLLKNPDPEQRFQMIVRLCHVATGVGGCSLFMPDDSNKTLVMRARDGYKHGAKALNTAFSCPLEATHGRSLDITAYISKKQEPVYEASRQEFREFGGKRDCFEAALWGEEGRRQTFYGTHIARKNGDASGVLRVEDERAECLTEEHLIIIEALAAFAGTVLDARDTATWVDSVLSRLALGGSTKSVLNSLVAGCTKQIRCQASSIFLYDKSIERLVMRGDFGHTKSFVGWTDEEHTYGMDGTTGWVCFKSDDGECTANSEDEVAGAHDHVGKLWRLQWKDNPTCHSFFVRRIGTKERPLGILKLENKINAKGRAQGAWFSESDKSYVRAFANALAVVVDLREKQELNDQLLNARGSYTDIFGKSLLNSIIGLNPDRIPKTGVDEWDHRNRDLLLETQRMCHDLQVEDSYRDIVETAKEEIGRVCSILRIPDGVCDLFNTLKQYEPVFYRSEGYRDHSVHTLNTFLLGFAILAAMEQDIFDHVHSELRSRFISTKSKARVDVFKTWALASLFHDVGQPIEEAIEWMPAFYRDLLYPKSPKKKVGLLLSPFLKEFLYEPYNGHMTEIQRILCDTMLPEERAKAKDIISREVHESQNHALIGAMLVLDRMSVGNNGPAERAIRTAAASAIAFHDKKVWGGMKNLHSGHIYNFMELPLEFLLMYCDNEEYGRPKSTIDARRKEIMSSTRLVPTLAKVDVRRNVSYELQYRKGLGLKQEQTIGGIYHELEQSWTCGFPGVTFKIEAYAEDKQGRHRISKASF